MTWTAQNIKYLGISERLEHVPDFLLPLIQSAIQELNPAFKLSRLAFKWD